MNNKTIKKITGVACLIAIEIILQIIGNYVSIFNGVSLNLSLVAVALASIVYGPFSGALLGLINGIIVLLSPSTQALFLDVAPLGTVVTCLCKCTLAGLISGFVYKAIAKKNATVGSIVASLLVPIINTGIFALCAMTLISKAIDQMNSNSVNAMRFLFLTVIGFNFIFEFTATTVLAPSLDKIRKIMTRSDKHAL